jgi:hypothetical protein
LELDLCFRKCKIMSYCLIEKPPPGGLYNVERIQFVASANTIYTFQSISVYCYKEIKTMPPNSISLTGRKPGKNPGFRQVRANLWKDLRQVTISSSRIKEVQVTTIPVSACHLEI